MSASAYIADASEKTMVFYHAESLLFFNLIPSATVIERISRRAFDRKTQRKPHRTNASYSTYTAAKLPSSHAICRVYVLISVQVLSDEWCKHVTS